MSFADRTISALALFPLLLLPQALLAQEEVVPPEDQETLAPEEKLPPAEAGGKKFTPAQGQTEAQAEHVVVPGDTLWDLCGRYLNNPWYWPRVWSYNPELTNPHWIYPGQKVRFYPGAGELPSEIEAGREFEMPEAVPEEPEEQEIPENLISMTGKIVQAKAVSAVTLKRTDFISAAELDASGVIHSSPEEKTYLSERDVVHVEFIDPGLAKVGGQFSVFRVKNKINHPVTGKFIGYHVAILGVAEVVSVDEKMSTAVIATSVEPIERGDRLIPLLADLQKNVAPRPNAVDLKGYVVGSQITLTNLGEHHVVFLDQGKEQGVEDGNVFDVVRREDGLFIPGTGKREGAWDPDLPMQVVGRIMVVDARENTSTGLVMASLKEIKVGDRVMMTIR